MSSNRKTQATSPLRRPRRAQHDVLVATLAASVTRDQILAMQSDPMPFEPKVTRKHLLGIHTRYFRKRGVSFAAHGSVAYPVDACVGINLFRLLADLSTEASDFFMHLVHDTGFPFDDEVEAQERLGWRHAFSAVFWQGGRRLVPVVVGADVDTGKLVLDAHADWFPHPQDPSLSPEQRVIAAQWPGAWKSRMKKSA